MKSDFLNIFKKMPFFLYSEFYFPEKECSENCHHYGKNSDYCKANQRIDLRNTGKTIPYPFHTIGQGVYKGDGAHPRRQGTYRKERPGKAEYGKDDKIHDELETGHIFHP